ncbi:endonuclease Q family protein [Paenibacillus senegalensis]|uniref:endonuclease Q family protein n=1 Tax=Paenibacillus senegalensis TaxID=1465766 RepID=UPI0002888887|nr:endonuclease Q family protein [Paenibacillus senegalensis]
MLNIFADLHIHIGRTNSGRAVKISGSRNLTFHEIAREASERKGIELIGIIDCHSPGVQEDIERYLEAGEMTELPGGGIRYRNTTVLLGTEIEVKDQGMGPAHLLVYLPTLAEMKSFTEWMKPHMSNIHLSSQRIYVPARTLQQEVLARGGILIPAHMFTPHKSVYGSCTDKLSHLLDLDGVIAGELGLSSDTRMASMLTELDTIAFVTNSDAHSLAKIGREYNRLKVAEPSFSECVKALKGEAGRAIIANYGLNPYLGKYHRSFCNSCGSTMDISQHPAAQANKTTFHQCPECGSKKLIRGVMNRIEELADRPPGESPPKRPPYYYQVPLEFIPGIGRRTLEDLLAHFGTEMNILHHVPEEELIARIGEEKARYLSEARSGQLGIEAGGGGHYGKVRRH